jgi:hypothetical protein
MELKPIAGREGAGAMWEKIASLRGNFSPTRRSVPNM